MAVETRSDSGEGIVITAGMDSKKRCIILAHNLQHEKIIIAVTYFCTMS